jgi:hypothetical protein
MECILLSVGALLFAWTQAHRVSAKLDIRLVLTYKGTGQRSQTTTGRLQLVMQSQLNGTLGYNIDSSNCYPFLLRP